MLPSISVIKSVSDDRGSLSFAEIGSGLPFEPRRFFIVHGVPPETVRGGHAHRRCEQFLVAAAGRVLVTLDDGEGKTACLLEEPGQGLHIPAGIWAEQQYLDPDSCLLVLASEPYDRGEYLTDYSEFLEFRKMLP